MNEPIKLAFVGDIMCGDSFSLIGRGAASMIDRHGARFLPDDIVQVFRSHDLVMGNIECVLSDVGRKENSLRQLHMRGRPATAGLLSKWGINVANVANNHILEQGRDAAVDTVSRLRRAGLQVIGAGAGDVMQRGLEPVELTVKETRFCMLGICLRDEKYAYDGGADVTEAIEQVRAARSRGDRVILSVHWGDELIEYPGLKQRKLARRFQQAGADLVIGHHPHVFQGVDRLDATVVAYSLGNFIFDGFSKSTGWSIILSVTIGPDRQITYAALPLIRGTDFRPQLAVGQQKEELLREIEKRNEACRMPVENDELFSSRYNERVRMLRQNSRRTLWKNLAKRFFGFKPVYWPQLLWRPVRRRLGTW